MSEDTSGPAFPLTLPPMQEKSIGFAGHEIPENMGAVYQGLSIRDYFAAKAMQAYFTGKGSVGWSGYGIAEGVERINALVDAMMKARGS